MERVKMPIDSFRLRHLVKWWLSAALSRLAPSSPAPRTTPVSLCLVFHTERLYDDRVYRDFLRFLEAFHRHTGTLAVACLMTPRCPAIQAALRQRNLDESVFVERVRAIAAHSHIGYHGHFYRDGDPGLPIDEGRPHDESVKRQFDAEVEWLSRVGFPARLYTGGWWYRDSAVVERLVAHGFEVDFSTWSGPRDPGTGRLRAERGHDAAGPGELFILPGTDSLLEVPSLVGPSDHPYWLVKRHLKPLLARDPAARLYAALPIHDWNLPEYGKHAFATVRFFASNPKVFAWRDVGDICREAREDLRPVSRRLSASRPASRC